MTSPEIRACAELIRPITVSELTLLPEPDSPTIPRVSPGCDRVRDTVDGLHDAVVGVEVHLEVFDLQQRLGHYVYLTLGSRNAYATSTIRFADRDEQRAEDRDTHHDREVVRADRRDRQLTDPRQSEQRLGDERAARAAAPMSRPSIVTTGVSAPRRPCL